MSTKLFSAVSNFIKKIYNLKTTYLTTLRVVFKFYYILTIIHTYGTLSLEEPVNVRKAMIGFFILIMLIFQEYLYYLHLSFYYL